jgi:hypothetical protein
MPDEDIKKYQIQSIYIKNILITHNKQTAEYRHLHGPRTYKAFLQIVNLSSL